MSEQLDGKTILVVDDDRDILTALEAVLGEMGAEVHTAADGNAALTEAEGCEPDLVILDQMLPKRSGFLVMEKLRRGEHCPKVIMITGNQGSRHKVYAQSLGVDAYLNKPFRMERLIDQVTDLLG